MWLTLKAIPYGVTASYGTIAKKVGNPNASRAVGAANGQNPVSIIVPCHRVIGQNGQLVGYGGGLAIKEALLELERGKGKHSGVKKTSNCPKNTKLTWYFGQWVLEELDIVT